MNDVRQVLLELNGTFLTASIMDYILPNAFWRFHSNFQTVMVMETAARCFLLMCQLGKHGINQMSYGQFMMWIGAAVLNMRRTENRRKETIVGDFLW